MDEHITYDAIMYVLSGVYDVGLVVPIKYKTSYTKDSKFAQNKFLRDINTCIVYIRYVIEHSKDKGAVSTNRGCGKLEYFCSGKYFIVNGMRFDYTGVYNKDSVNIKTLIENLLFLYENRAFIDSFLYESRDFIDSFLYESRDFIDSLNNQMNYSADSIEGMFARYYHNTGKTLNETIEYLENEGFSSKEINRVIQKVLGCITWED